MDAVTPAFVSRRRGQRWGLRRDSAARCWPPPCLSGTACVRAEDADRPRTLPANVAASWADFRQVWAAGAANERIRLEYENDMFYNRDQFYTDGVRLTLRRGTGLASKFE